VLSWKADRPETKLQWVLRELEKIRTGSCGRTKPLLRGLDKLSYPVDVGNFYCVAFRRSVWMVHVLCLWLYCLYRHI